MNHLISSLTHLYSANKALAKNFIFILLFNFIWSFGNPMVYASTMIPSFMNLLDAQPLIIGLIQMCTSLPVVIQLLPRFVDMKLNNTKRLLVIIYSAVGIGYALFGIIASFSLENKAAFVWILLAVYFIIYTIYLLGSIIYLDYITRIFPANMLGRLYGIQGTLMSVGSVVGGLIVGPVLASKTFPSNYSLLFIIAGVLFLLSSFCCMFTQDVSKEDEIPKAVHGIKEYAKKVLPVMKSKIVIYFSLFMCFIYFINTPYGFIYSFVANEKHMAVSAATVTTIAYLSQAVLLPIVGFCMDKYGRMRTITTYVGLCLASVALLITPWKYAYIVVYIMFGMYALFISLVKVRLANEVVPAANRMDVIVFVNVVGVLIGSVFSLIFGIISQITKKYEPVFIISAAVGVVFFYICFRLHLLIKEKNSIKQEKFENSIKNL